MIQLSQRFLYVLLLLLSIFVFGIANQALSNPKADSQSKVTFYVQWYDVGKSALVGLNGISHVTKGFKNLKEINTVFYEPNKITIEDMVKALKAAGTYRGLAE